MRSARWANIGRKKEHRLVPIIAGIFAPNDLKTEMAAIENKAYCNAHSDFFLDEVEDSFEDVNDRLQAS